MKYTSPSNSIDFLELENLESISTAEPRGPPFTPSKIGFRKWHNSKTALSKPLFKNVHSLKIVSVMKEYSLLKVSQTVHGIRI